MLFVFALYLPFSLLNSKTALASRESFQFILRLSGQLTCRIIYRLRQPQWGSAKEEQCEKRNRCGQKSQRGGFESSLWDLKDDRLPAGVCNAILTTLKKTGNSKLTFLGFSCFLWYSSHTQKMKKNILLVYWVLLIFPKMWIILAEKKHSTLPLSFMQIHVSSWMRNPSSIKQVGFWAVQAATIIITTVPLM